MRAKVEENRERKKSRNKQLLLVTENGYNIALRKFEKYLES